MSPEPHALLTPKEVFSFGTPDLERRDAGGVQPEPGRQHVPEDDLVDLLGRELRPLNGLPHGDRAELGGGLLGQGTAQGTDGGTHCARR